MALYKVGDNTKCPIKYATIASLYILPSFSFTVTLLVFAVKLLSKENGVNELN